MPSSPLSPQMPLNVTQSITPWGSEMTEIQQRTKLRHSSSNIGNGTGSVWDATVYGSNVPSLQSLEVNVYNAFSVPAVGLRSWLLHEAGIELPVCWVTLTLKTTSHSATFQIWSVVLKMFNLELGVAVHTFNLRTWEVEAGRSLLGWGWSGLHSELQMSQGHIVRLWLKNKPNKTAFSSPNPHSALSRGFEESPVGLPTPHSPLTVGEGGGVFTIRVFREHQRIVPFPHHCFLIQISHSKRRNKQFYIRSAKKRFAYNCVCVFWIVDLKKNNLLGNFFFFFWKQGPVT